MSIKDVRAVDLHAHYGIYYREGKDLLNKLLSGDLETVVARAKLANTCLTVVSSSHALTPRFKAKPVEGNADASRRVREIEGLLHWVVVDPLVPETYKQADDMLALPQCAGIKIHPEEHGYHISEHGRPLFEFARKHGALMIGHSGEERSMPEDFVPFTNDFPDVRFILAHLGHGFDGDPSHQVRAIQASESDNVYVDTSSSRSILSGLLEWAVGEIGAERIVFGTDNPLYFAPAQRARIDNAGISDREKRLILCENAERLLNLK